jgi:AcrR family transcriptional regulator
MLGAESLREHRLPPGRHGLTREQVAENQRLRLIAAAAEELAERGSVATTSSSVARRAGVSPATFYAHYENIAACLLAAHEAAARCVWEIFERSCDEPQIEWRRRLEDGVRRTLRFFAAEPALAILLGPEALAGDPRIAASREAEIERLAERLEAARESRSKGPRPAAAAAAERHLVGAALGLVGERAAAGAAAGLPELTPQLVELLSGRAGM